MTMKDIIANLAAGLLSRSNYKHLKRTFFILDMFSYPLPFMLAYWLTLALQITSFSCFLMTDLSMENF